MKSNLTGNKYIASWWLHLVFWLSIITYHFVTNELTGDAGIMLYLGLSLLFIYIPFTYLTYWLALRPYNEHKNLLLLLLWILVLLIGFVVVGYVINVLIFVIHDILNVAYERAPKFNRSFIYNMMDFYLLQYFIFALVYWYAERSINNRARYQQAEVEKMKTEYDYLKSQINPHFLYNTLDLFYAKTLKSDKKTANGIAVLASIMRYSLNTGDAKGQIPLVQEVEQVENYIYLQQERFEGKLNIVFEYNEIPDSAAILPHALITLVENACKYGVANDSGDPIKINLNVSEDKLLFELSNRISYEKKDLRAGGIGLQNLIQRFKLAYPNKHRYQAWQDGERYTTQLEINYR
jgi:two-component system, LytTR family, sensor kinase